MKKANARFAAYPPPCLREYGKKLRSSPREESHVALCEVCRCFVYYCGVFVSNCLHEFASRWLEALSAARFGPELGQPAMDVRTGRDKQHADRRNFQPHILTPDHYRGDDQQS